MSSLRPPKVPPPVTSPADSADKPKGTTHPRLAPGRRRFPFALLLVVALIISATGAGVAWSLWGTSSGSTTSTDNTTGAAQFDQPVSEFPAADRGAAVALAGTTLTGEHLDVAHLRGKVVVVNVWGSWCAPCRTEAPVLAALSRSYADRGVAFVGVNVKDNRAAALAFERSYGIAYPSIEDPDGRAVLALSQYVPASAVPVTLVLDTEGRVAARVLGAVREATLRALLDSALAQKP